MLQTAEDSGHGGIAWSGARSRGGGRLATPGRSPHLSIFLSHRADSPKLVGGRLMKGSGRGDGGMVRSSWDERGRMVAGRLLPRRSQGRGGGRMAGSWDARPRMVAGRILAPRSRDYQVFMSSHPSARHGRQRWEGWEACHLGSEQGAADVKLLYQQL